MRKQIFLVLYVIVLLASPMFATAQSSCGPRDFFCDVGGGIKVPVPWNNAVGPAGETSIGGLLMSVIQLALIIVGSVAVLFIIIGGFRYITAYGNEEQAEGAKKTLLHAVLGLAIVILSFAMVSIISRLLIAGKVI